MNWKFGFFLVVSSLVISVPASKADSAVADSTNYIDAAARYRGFFEVQTLLNQRIGITNFGIDLGSYLNLPQVTDEPRPLLNLLGAYGLGSEFKNGSPNSLNFLMWYILFRGFANDLASACNSDAPSAAMLSNLDPTFRKLLNHTCETHFADSDLNSVWYAVMGFEPPSDELEIWKRDVQAFPMVKESERLSQAFLLLFLNPHFLLEP